MVPYYDRQEENTQRYRQLIFFFSCRIFGLYHHLDQSLLQPLQSLKSKKGNLEFSCWAV